MNDLLSDGAEKTMTNDSLEFVIYVIYKLAEAWGINPSQVYSVLNKSGALNNYLIPCYDVLHTLGGEYLVEDVTGYVRERGFSV